MGFYILLHVEETRESQQREDMSALLKRLMSTTGITQQEIARRSGIPFQTISAWVRGARTPGGGVEGKRRLRDLGEKVPGLTVLEVFQAAGISVPGELSPAAERRVMEMLRNLSPGRQTVALRVVEALHIEQAEEGVS